MMQLPDNLTLKFIGGPMDGVYSGGEQYPDNVRMLLHGYYVASKEGEIGITIQPASPQGLPSTFKPEHLRTEGIKGGKYVVVQNETDGWKTDITFDYQGIGGYPSDD